MAHHGHPPPAEATRLVARLRQLRPDQPARNTAITERWGLRALGGGRNNDVYLWPGPTGEICVKLYRKTDDRRRCEREWHALNLLANQGLDYAPTPLWLDRHPRRPAIGMSRLPGAPLTTLTDAAEVAAGLAAIAQATRTLQQLPLGEPFNTLDRVDSAQHYITRLTDIWPAQLAEHAATNPHDRITAGMLTLLRRWEASGDKALLRQSVPMVFSRGDGNLVNWHYHAQRVYCVDFEYSGHSDIAVDAADLTEHISSRAIPDPTWRALEPELGINHDNRARFAAAQRTFALRWLAVLWKRRTQRPHEFTAQRQRVRNLFD